MRWLGLDWDEGPPSVGYRQTERAEIYRAHAERLLAEGQAYRCRVHAEELDALRQAAQQRGDTFRYPGTCRDAGVPATEPHALRLRTPREGQTVVDDVIHGPVAFDNAHARRLDPRAHGRHADLQLLQRGGRREHEDHPRHPRDDHLSNTPKQLQCYQALGYPAPVFAHIPMILGADKSRLSKRHGATSVQAFREPGFLPEAMVNYLARLGWSHGDQEIFTREELIREFDLGQVGKAGAIFDHSKLEWLSHQWIRRRPPQRVAADLGRSSAPTRAPRPRRSRLARPGGRHAEGAGEDPERDGGAGDFY